MKKEYIKPQMEVVEIGVSQFLCVSTNSGEFGAPPFELDSEDEGWWMMDDVRWMMEDV